LLVPFRKIFTRRGVIGCWWYSLASVQKSPTDGCVWPVLGFYANCPREI
jgi:hypothetical protein